MGSLGNAETEYTIRRPGSDQEYQRPAPGSNRKGLPPKQKRPALTRAASNVRGSGLEP